MNGRRPGAAAVRSLVVLALLLGVLAMHGLSMGHDSRSMAAEMSSPATTEISMSVRAVDAMLMPVTDVVDVAAADLVADVQGSMPGPVQGHLAHLGAGCVAVLTGALTLMLLLLALRRGSQVELYRSPPLAGVVRRPVRAAPAPRPSLTTLCLSRT